MKKRYGFLGIYLFIGVLVLSGCLADSNGEFLGDTTTSEEIIPRSSRENILYFNGYLNLKNLVDPMAQSFNSEFLTWSNVSVELEDRDIRIYTSGSSTEQGIRALIDGDTSFAMADRKLLQEEENMLIDPSYYELAREAYVIINHRNSPIKNISLEGLRDIFSYKITDWSQINASYPREKIGMVILQEEADYIYNSSIFSQDKFFENIILVETVQEYEEALKDRPWTLGLSLYNSRLASNTNFNKLKVNGVEPSIENIEAGNYLLDRPLYLIGSGDLTKEQELFLDYILNEVGQEKIRSRGFIGQGD